MELDNILWILGLFAFIQMWGLSSRISRLERAQVNNTEIADLTEIIVTHIGKQIDTITLYFICCKSPLIQIKIRGREYLLFLPAVFLQFQQVFRVILTVFHADHMFQYPLQPDHLLRFYLKKFTHFIIICLKCQNVSLIHTAIQFD